ncbi:Gly-Xaa carboxypeptidase [Ceratobasidium sp. AG-Ba]|nr:Gly-Xaa carboxypeptidase [Ceratobasidium sp. AG-Ba]QRW05271.1 Gly-Xaa carboxypeptidase [Ceratobasidium sp. AG-Ba]
MSPRFTEKSTWPLVYAAPNVGKAACNSRRYTYTALIATLLLLYPLSCAVTRHHNLGYELQKTDVCVQVEPLSPKSEANRKLADELGAVFADASFKAVAAEHLGGAVRIPTESYDDMGPPGNDPRWDVFYNLSSHLLETYPKVHATLTQTRINTHALLYYWSGSDSSLKPILLAAHQDVVPVDPNTVSSWIHPPYSGYYDGEWVWGRGSADDKTGLVGIMLTLEKLIDKGFKPRRGILVGLGIDEESSGEYGADSIAKHIEEHYGKNSVSVLVDEGDGIQQVGDIGIAAVDVAEKGYLDVRVEVATPGGHSSVPPQHTSIGILASLLVEIEATPYPYDLPRSSPAYSLLQCLAAHVPSLPSSFRHAVFTSVCPPGASLHAQRKCDKALKQVEQQLFDANSELNNGSEFEARSYRSLLSTTQAIDMISGGVKSNALPELASAVVNHRIRTDRHVIYLQKMITAKLLPLAKKYNLTLSSFASDQNLTTGALGTLTLSDAWGTALEPAPVTPTEGKEAAAYRLLSGVIRKTRGDKKTAVSPSVPGGNTDTKSYWDITPNIFRYSHMSDGDLYNGLHTINEAMRASGFVEMIQFFKNFILTADDSDEI